MDRFFEGNYYLISGITEIDIKLDDNDKAKIVSMLNSLNWGELQEFQYEVFHNGKTFILYIKSRDTIQIKNKATRYFLTFTLDWNGDKVESFHEKQFKIIEPVTLFQCVKAVLGF